ncbi:MAG: DJ-1/PfpI family protein [Opitutaceae bacterium]
MAEPPRKLTVGAVLFEGFELLDVFGPLELFGLLRDRVTVELMAETVGPVRSSHGPAAVAERTLDGAWRPDVLLVPGGIGTRKTVDHSRFMEPLVAMARDCAWVASVCTGAALLARGGVLDGRSATTNKLAFAWVAGQGPRVNWVREARWVEDGKYFTSSGVAAGMDMALGLIERLFGREASLSVAQRAEYEWHEDKTQDPFARRAGLAP